jgi:hypothetical protein
MNMKFEIRKTKFETNSKSEGKQIRNERASISAFSSFRFLICFVFRISCFGFAVLAGCHQAHVTQPMSKDLLASDPDSQINFWHTLTDAPICSNDAAFHGLLLYFDSTDDCADYAARVQLLKSRGMLAQGFNEPADAAVRRGTIAVALCKALEIKGGVTMRLLGPSDRYAARELQFMGLYPAGSPQQTFTGNEYVGIIGRIEDYQRGDSSNKPASKMQDHDQPLPR